MKELDFLKQAQNNLKNILIFTSLKELVLHCCLALILQMDLKEAFAPGTALTNPNTTS